MPKPLRISPNIQSGAEYFWKRTDGWKWIDGKERWWEVFIEFHNGWNGGVGLHAYERWRWNGSSHTLREQLRNLSYEESCKLVSELEEQIAKKLATKPTPFQVANALEEAAYQSEEADNGLGPDLRRAAIDVVEHTRRIGREAWINLFGRAEIERGHLSVVPCHCTDDPACKGWQVVYPGQEPSRPTQPGDVANDHQLDKRAWDCYLGDREQIDDAQRSERQEY